MLLHWVSGRGVIPQDPSPHRLVVAAKRDEGSVIVSLSAQQRGMSFPLHKLPLWSEVSCSLRDALERLELTEASELVHFMDGSVEDASKVLQEMGCGSDLAVQFVALWEQARAPAKRHIQQLASFTVLEASSRQVVREAEQKRLRTHLAVSSSPITSASIPVSFSSGKGQRWPTRLRKLLHTGHTKYVRYELMFVAVAIFSQASA